MRESLRALNGRRIEVFARVGKYGKKAGYKGRELKTVCLENLTDRAGALLTDHLWMTVGKQFAALRLRVGDQIKFIARSRPYLKGHAKEKRVDWCLSNPTNFVKLSGIIPEFEKPQLKMSL